MTDGQKLNYAISQERALVTFNVADYVKLNNEYTASGKRHYGVILSEQLPIGEIVRRLLRLLSKFTAGELENSLWWL